LSARNRFSSQSSTRVAVRAGEPERAVPQAVAGVDVDAGGDQEARRLDAVAVGRRDERGAAANVPGLHARTFGEEALHRLRVARLGGADQLGVPAGGALGAREAGHQQQCGRHEGPTAHRLSFR